MMQSPHKQRVDQLGRVYVTATLANEFDLALDAPEGRGHEQARRVDVEFLMDSDAEMLCLPTPVIAKLGLRETRRGKVRTGNEVADHGILVPVRVEIDLPGMEKRIGTIMVMEAPDAQPVLGRFAQAALVLFANPNTKQLEGDPFYGGEYITDCLSNLCTEIDAPVTLVSQ